MKFLTTTLRVFRVILSDWFYIKVALAGAIVLGFVNYWLLSQVTTIPMFYDMAAAGEFGAHGQLYAGIYTTTSLLIAVLFGLSTALLVWQWKHSKIKALWKEISTGGLGGLASAFGAACPVCGAFLLSLLGVVGGVSAFPLKGLEFHLISLLLLVATIVYGAHKAAPILDGTCTTCVVGHAHTGRRVRFVAEQVVIGVIIVALLANHFLIGGIGVAMGLVKPNSGVTNFLSTLLVPQAAAAKSIYATKLNPDGRTTTVAQWPTITEVPAEPRGVDVVEAAKIVMVPTGTPFYAPEGISFDTAEASLTAWGKYEDSLQLTGDSQARWEKIVGTMTCDYCCGTPTNVTHINNCGCAHAKAFRSIAKYLLKNYEDKYSDDEILGELQRWKGAWYPKGVVEDYLLATGRGDVLGHENHGGAGADGKHGF